LKQTKDDDDGGSGGDVCLLSVLARTEFNHLPATPLPSPGREQKNIAAGFLFSVSQTLLLNGSRDSFRGTPEGES
jgi:hypothetical protein